MSIEPEHYPPAPPAPEWRPARPREHAPDADEIRAERERPYHDDLTAELGRESRWP
jgi:hypothetical protein